MANSENHMVGFDIYLRGSAMTCTFHIASIVDVAVFIQASRPQVRLRRVDLSASRCQSAAFVGCEEVVI